MWWRLMLGGTAPNRVPRLHLSLFQSSLLSVLCIVPHWAWDHFENSQPWLQMKSTKHCKFKYFFKKFWLIFHKQRKSTIQNLDLIFLCRMPGLRWGPKSGTYEFKFSPGPASFQKVLMLFTSQYSNWTIILTPPHPSSYANLPGW